LEPSHVCSQTYYCPLWFITEYVQVNRGLIALLLILGCCTKFSLHLKVAIVRDMP
jgi:hypothetical protein